MDNIEQQAMGTQPAATATAAPATGGPVGGLTPEQQQTFEQQRHDMASGYNSKFRALASERREVEAERAQLAAERAYMNQANANPDPVQAQRLSETLPPDIASRMDDSGRYLLDTIGTQMSETVRPYAEKLGEYEGKITALEQKLTQREQRDEQTRIQQEARGLVEKYGENAINGNSESINHVLKIMPGINLEAALRLVAPDVHNQHLRRQWEHDEARNRESSGIQAGLEGMFPQPSQAPNSEYSDGEDMMSSAMGALGAGRIRTEAIKNSLA